MYYQQMTAKTDTRNLPAEAQQQLRVQIVRLRQSGVTNRDVARKVGVSERHASVTWQRFLKEGGVSLESKIRGRAKGQHKKIGAIQAAKVYRLMFDKPSSLGIPGELWTRCRMQQAVKQHMKIQVSIRTIGGLLSHWGMIPQKPIDIDKINAPIIQKWVNAEYTNLLERVEVENGELHWYVKQMVEPPQEYQHWSKPSLFHPMLATISRQGQIRFIMSREEMNTSKIFREFLTGLMAEVDKKIFLLVKRAACLHINKRTEEWLEEHKDLIEVLYLPV